MKKYIVVENNSFKPIELETVPLNIVLCEPDFNTWTNSYTLINSGVDVFWQDYYNDTRKKCLSVIYKNTVLLELNRVGNIQMVIDTLNKFNTISSVELKKRYEEAQKKEKSVLESEIRTLIMEKAALIKKMQVYEEIEQKGNEIKELLLKLKD
jgi:hypothetical protein